MYYYTTFYNFFEDFSKIVYHGNQSIVIYTRFTSISYDLKCPNRTIYDFSTVLKFRGKCSISLETFYRIYRLEKIFRLCIYHLLILGEGR